MAYIAVAWRLKHASWIRHALLDKDSGENFSNENLRGGVNGLPATITRRKVWSARKIKRVVCNIIQCFV